MKSRLVSALALSFVLAPIAAAPALAEQPAAFRTAAPQAFSADDMQRYGLSDAQTARAMDLQEQGYELMVMTPEEADQYTAGLTDQELLLVAILVGVVVIAVAVA